MGGCFRLLCLPRKLSDPPTMDNAADMRRLITLPRGAGPTSVRVAFERLASAIASLAEPLVDNDEGSSEQRLTRIEIEVDGVVEVAHWLVHQRYYPRVYLSDQHKTLRVAGIGAADRLQIKSSASEARVSSAPHALLARAFRVLRGAPGRMRFYGGMRFDPGAEQQAEWASFGESVFVLPLWELQTDANGRCWAACHLRWTPTSGAARSRDSDESFGESRADSPEPPRGWADAARHALHVLQQLCPSAEPLPPTQQSLPTLVGHQGSLGPSDWEVGVRTVLEGIEAGEWTKVVLAQRVRVLFNAAVEPMHLLLRLLEADDAAIARDNATGVNSNGTGQPAAHPPDDVVGSPRHAYLFLLQLSADDSFMGCTPEKLFKIEGEELSTEAIAGTRPRGETAEADQRLAHELLRCDKDLREVMAVRDFLLKALEPACSQLQHSAPFVLQLRHVQHICVPFSAQLKRSAEETQHHLPISLALALLHPTPAVCGTPSAAARHAIQKLERFDRGFYSGPLGYLGADGCEFCVAIRSALIRGREASIYAGAGIVRGSTAVSEWEEVHMKMKNFVSLFPVADRLAASPATPYLQLPNLNILHGVLLIEELLRSGLGHVFMCPGSRCAPLTIAVARSGCAHTLVNDERGAGFMALGFARSSGRCAAVVVSSGTAVANLLPSVVEAWEDHVPLLLLTADRPPEARDTEANQAVAQVGMLGRLKWFKDLGCPTPQVPLEALLSDASYALARAFGPPGGPVHLNVMLREPLDPSPESWPRELLGTSRMLRWVGSRQPFTNYMSPYTSLPQLAPDAQLLPVVDALRGARRGLIVAGALKTHMQKQAVKRLACHLGWPVMMDICSGLRRPEDSFKAPLVPLGDLLLAAEPSLARAVSADVVLQIGGRLVSKRLQALVAAASDVHIVVDEHGDRADPSHSVTHRLQGNVSSVLNALAAGFQEGELPCNPLLAFVDASRVAELALQSCLRDNMVEDDISEVWVARHLCSVLVRGGLEDEVLFASNSLPIRHLDGYCAVAPTVLANRGASGIDGILHTALGTSLGGVSRCTLLVGDLATLHDLNALATAQTVKTPLTIVILNNQGGGIFRFLPIASHKDVYSPYFDTPHTHSFEHCCKAFGLTYCATPTRAAFIEALERSRREAGPFVIEVPTDKEHGHFLSQQLRAASRETAKGLADTLCLSSA